MFGPFDSFASAGVSDPQESEPPASVPDTGQGLDAPAADLSLSFNLLQQAIDSFADTGRSGDAESHVADAAQEVEALRSQLVLYESQIQQLHAELERAKRCAYGYWQRCKSIEAELRAFKGGASAMSPSPAAHSISSEVTQ